jgi:bifunctional non-homologous end joining protein LigD
VQRSACVPGVIGICERLTLPGGHNGSVIDFGISAMPPDGESDEAFLDRLAAAGYRALELPFVNGFPWKERRCVRFGELAADRGIALSIHAPYFAILTIEDEDRARQSLAALEHTMKLGRALGSAIICAHGGNVGGREPDELMNLVRSRLEWIAPKVDGLGVGLGLETAGKDGAFGTLGDIALLAGEFRFVRPVVDWAHLHARTGGALTSKEAFGSVLAFVRESFPGWMIDPLQAQFTDNLLGAAGEVRHLPYGEGTLRVGPLVEAAFDAGIRMVLISEARETSSHEAIHAEIEETLSHVRSPERRTIGSGAVHFPEPIDATPEPGGRWSAKVGPRLLLSNLDKPFFPDGYTKGDLVQYYASVAPVLLPHLAARPISMSRYPDGIDGNSFYEKRAPSHRPDWIRTIPVSSESMGGTIDFVGAADRASLMWLANMGCIEIHPFHSREGSLDRPDWAVFDLDPAEGSTWEQLVTVGGLLRQALEGLGLAAVPKLSGARGLHVYVPLEAVHSHRRVRRFVEAVGRLLVQADPDDVTMDWEIEHRTGRVFVDHNRNAPGQTIASVYSVRPRPGAPVSAPIHWEELSSISNGDIDIANLWERLRRHGDLFAPVLAGSQTLDVAEEALGLEPGEPDSR